MDKLKEYFKLKNVLKAFLAVFTYYFFFYIFSLLATFFIKAVISSNYLENHSTFFSILMQFIVYLPILIILIILFKDDLVDDILKTRGRPYITSHKIIKGFFLMYGINILANILTLVLNNNESLPVSQNQLAIEEMFKSSTFAPFILFIIIGLIGPLVEEIIFRKCFRSIIRNDIAFIIISTIIFGFMHVISSSGSFKQIAILAIPYMASGFTFSFLYIKNGRNLFVPTICHMLSNSLACVIILVTTLF